MHITICWEIWVLVKQMKGRDFYGCLAYVLGKAGARPLDSNMQADNPNELNHEFQVLDAVRPRVQRRVYHCALSLPIGEHLSDHDWRELSKDFLAQMGFADHQYVLAQHTDREHEHVHIIANRVGLDGAVVPDAWDYQRAEAVARQLELAYDLQPLRSSGATDRKALSHRQLAQERQTGQSCVQRQLQDGIDAALPTCRHFNALAEVLAAQCIQTKITYGSQNQPIGISYAKAGVTMSGSNLGKRYTLEAVHQHFQKGVQDNQLEVQPSDQVQAVREQMVEIIDRLGQDKPTLSELIERLAQEGIEVHLRFGRLRNERQQVKAIRYSQGDIAFLGQSLGDSYHFAGLQTHLGIDYDAQRDNAWFRQWRDQWRDQQQAQQQAQESLTQAQPIRRVIFASSPVSKRFSRSLRDQTIGWLSDEIMMAFQQAQTQGYAQFQCVTTAAPGIDQWGTVAALKLREAQGKGEIAAVPAIEVVVLTQRNLAEQWSKTQKAQYDRLLKVVDRLDDTADKIDYLTAHSLILGNAGSVSATDQALIQATSAENIKLQVQAAPPQRKANQTGRYIE
jgi:hypothetical protein